MARRAFTLAAGRWFHRAHDALAMLEVLHQDFIRTADAKGLPWSVVVGAPRAAERRCRYSPSSASHLAARRRSVEQVFRCLGRICWSSAPCSAATSCHPNAAVRRGDHPLVNLTVDAYAGRSKGPPEQRGAADRIGDLVRAARLTVPALRRLMHNRSFVIGAALVLFVALIAIFADCWRARSAPNFRARLSRRTAALVRHRHWPRPAVARDLWRPHIAVDGFVVVVPVAGTTIGVAGYSGPPRQSAHAPDDALMAFPAILLAIVISAVLPRSSTW
jgi:hypothetical protein